MKTKVIAVPLEEGSQIEGSKELVKYLQKNDIAYDNVVFFNKEKSNLKSVYNCCKKLKQTVLETLEEKQFPLVIGGDHAVSIGSVSAIMQKNDFSVIWIDAHGDINTPSSSLTKRIHGMPLATLMKKGYPILSSLTEDKTLKHEDINYLGLRCLDPYEQEYLDNNNINYYSDAYIKENSIKTALDNLKSNIFKPIHISLDLDAIDPKDCPAVNTPAKGGLNLLEVKEILDFLFDNFKVISFDLVEYNPLKDIENKTACIIKEIVELVKEKVSNF